MKRLSILTMLLPVVLVACKTSGGGGNKGPNNQATATTPSYFLDPNNNTITFTRDVTIFGKLFHAGAKTAEIQENAKELCQALGLNGDKYGYEIAKTYSVDVMYRGQILGNDSRPSYIDAWVFNYGGTSEPHHFVKLTCGGYLSLPDLQVFENPKYGNSAFERLLNSQNDLKDASTSTAQLVPYLAFSAEEKVRFYNGDGSKIAHRQEINELTDLQPLYIHNRALAICKEQGFLGDYALYTIGYRSEDYVVAYDALQPAYSEQEYSHKRVKNGIGDWYSIYSAVFSNLKCSDLNKK